MKNSETLITCAVLYSILRVSNRQIVKIKSGHFYVGYAFVRSRFLSAINFFYIVHAFDTVLRHTTENRRHNRVLSRF